MDCGFIDDGYTRTGYVSAVDGLHPACRFEFRPVLARERAILCGEINRRNDPAWAESASCDLLKKQLVSWDLKNKSGRLVEITVENLRRVVPALHGKIYSIVMGFTPSEIDPDAPETTKQDLTEEQEEKNCLPG